MRKNCCGSKNKVLLVNIFVKYTFNFVYNNICDEDKILCWTNPENSDNVFIQFYTLSDYTSFLSKINLTPVHLEWEAEAFLS